MPSLLRSPQANSRISVLDIFKRLSRLVSQGSFLCVVGLAPLPYGSRDASTVSLWCVLLGLALIAVPMRDLGRPQLMFSMGLVFILCCAGFILHEQLSSTPWIAETHPLWDKAGQALGYPIQSFVSIVRDQPFYAAGPLLAAILALWLGLILGSDAQTAWRLLWVVSTVGAFCALYGILTAIFDPTILLFRERESFIGFVTGSFVNRNTAAVYFGSCTVLWQLLLTDHARKLLPRAFSNRLRAGDVIALSKRGDILLRIAGFFICIMALFMTGSRAGIVLSLVTLAGAMMLQIGKDRSQRRRILVLFAYVIGVIMSFYFVLGGMLDARFEMQGFNDGGRMATYHSILLLIEDRPWFGSGVGTFAWAFPAYRGSNVSLWGIWDLAHSTPLELAVDFGLPFTLLIGVAWIITLWILFRGVFIRRRNTVIPLAALSVGAIGLLHSAIDFSLQVPGFAIVVMATIGVGVAQAFPSQSRRYPS